MLATELHPASLGGFATASVWLNSARQDFVTQTEFTDRDHVSIGCATLFINYLRHQLHFTLPQIVQAAGSTQQTFETLTGSSDAFGSFSALLDAFFPQACPSICQMTIHFQSPMFPMFFSCRPARQQESSS